MADNVNKIKLLKIVGYLSTESSEDNPVTTYQIIDYLGSIGISCDRRTLYRDMDLLMDSGLGIEKTLVSRENAYYIENDALTLAELKILIDAVQAANFITPDKTSDLIEKLIGLAGTRKKEILRKNTIFYNNHKHSNEDIFDNIEKIEISIQKKRQVSFYYFDLNEKHERVYRKDKKRYVTDPVALVYNEDNYYLVTYSRKYAETVNYRVDRMDTVEVEETSLCDEARIRKKRPHTYTEQVFKMYNGTTTDVILEFEPDLLGAIYDKFGEDLFIRHADEDKLRIKVTIQVSPPFWGWVMQFGGRMKIVSPHNIDPGF
ncbi:WYL domain-containing protein [Ruminococcus sp.]|uniref:helix-turn-helix transcriptional regulator n=1 Tax=Ruminococcus sp. TaxID=41978 RepID=UPI0025DF25AC|nr:WYL domain-containing protein [Ruminococcus sp.]MBR1430999.1 WYL domain-containing protein [Ruminococcus sp.]